MKGSLETAVQDQPPTKMRHKLQQTAVSIGKKKKSLKYQKSLVQCWPGLDMFQYLSYDIRGQGVELVIVQNPYCYVVG